MKDKRLIARFRCGNKLRGEQFWRKEEERKCRVCGEETNVTHILEECQKTKTGRRRKSARRIRIEYYEKGNSGEKVLNAIKTSTNKRRELLEL